MQLPNKVKQKLRELPDRPGCYLMRDRRGRIIYVGKAASLRKRVQSYFRDATLKSGSAKLRGMVRSVADIETMVVRNEAEAILTEGRLIKEYKPRYNVRFRDDKRFLLLVGDPAQPYPVFKLCRIQRDDQRVYFGPYASSAATRATLDFIEKRFGLRKCGPRIPDRATYKHCLNDIIRFCSAPCVGRIDPGGYHERFDEACAFLGGKRPGILKELREAMLTASGESDFERAAALRDTLFSLQATVRQKARMAPTPEMRAEDARAGIVELKTALGLAVVPTVIECFDISNISGTYAVASMVCFVDGLPRRNRYRRFRIKTVQGSDDPRMMAEAVRRRFDPDGRDAAALPDLVVVDGGGTQLRAARDELVAAGLPELPAAGLAKRYEEVYRQDADRPLRLPRTSPALKVLQRIRDEAHRFAITYHRQLRRKRMRDSVLDDIPRIGPKRKRLLLEHFGSVNRLLRADKDRIAQVPGIGYEMARLIYERLQKGA